ncbi:hypothetical protein MnTg02_01352 [bacterium MnTg02]|nr:hypothetical protein MnTg02_01352 [bacterium MnTg02]
MTFPFVIFDPGSKFLNRSSTAANVANPANSEFGDESSDPANLAKSLISDLRISKLAGLAASDLDSEKFAEFEERAAILEFEAGLTRQEAERRALIELETIQKGN